MVVKFNYNTEIKSSFPFRSTQYNIIEKIYYWGACGTQNKWSIWMIYKNSDQIYCAG